MSEVVEGAVVTAAEHQAGGLCWFGNFGLCRESTRCSVSVSKLLLLTRLPPSQVLSIRLRPSKGKAKEPWGHTAPRGPVRLCKTSLSWTRKKKLRRYLGDLWYTCSPVVLYAWNSVLLLVSVSEKTGWAHVG